MTVVRPLRADDKAAWRRLWRGYLAFYETSLNDDVTSNTYARLVSDARYIALAAERDGALVGFAHCLVHPSTWSKADYCYLEDLFTSEVVRGAGAGRALIEAVYTEADRRGCARVYWNTEEGNNTARRLYDKLATVSDFVQYRR